MELRVVERREDIAHVELDGRLDVAGMHSIEIEFFAQTAGRERPAIVDLSRVEFVASRGVGMLFNCAKSLDRGGNMMVLVNPQPDVERTLIKVGAHKVIPIVKSLDEALERIQG